MKSISQFKKFADGFKLFTFVETL